MKQKMLLLQRIQISGRPVCLCEHFKKLITCRKLNQTHKWKMCLLQKRAITKSFFTLYYTSVHSYPSLHCFQADIWAALLNLYQIKSVTFAVVTETKEKLHPCNQLIWFYKIDTFFPKIRLKLISVKSCNSTLHTHITADRYLSSSQQRTEQVHVIDSPKKNLYNHIMRE